MQKISPLKTSLEAFRKFKTERIKNKELKNNPANTNPFGITFKGTVLQMDVFESEAKKGADPVQNKIKEFGKLTVSAWNSAIGRLSSIKQNTIAFMGKIGQNTKDFFHKLNTTNVDFDFMKYSVNNLSKKDVSELGAMLEAEIAKI